LSFFDLSFFLLRILTLTTQSTFSDDADALGGWDAMLVVRVCKEGEVRNSRNQAGDEGLMMPNWAESHHRLPGRAAPAWGHSFIFSLQITTQHNQTNMCGSFLAKRSPDFFNRLFSGDSTCFSFFPVSKSPFSPTAARTRPPHLTTSYSHAKSPFSRSVHPLSPHLFNKHSFQNIFCKFFLLGDLEELNFLHSECLPARGEDFKAGVTLVRPVPPATAN
jgi:hypothetical protein